jgi:hypothetical protein
MGRPPPAGRPWISALYDEPQRGRHGTGAGVVGALDHVNQTADSSDDVRVVHQVRHGRPADSAAGWA